MMGKRESIKKNLIGQLYSANEDAKMAEEFKKVIPVFEQLGEAAKEVIG